MSIIYTSLPKLLDKFPGHHTQAKYINLVAKKSKSHTYNYFWSRLTVVSHEAKKKQHVRASSGPHDHYSELFTQMAALKFESAVTQPL